MKTRYYLQNITNGEITPIAFKGLEYIYPSNDAAPIHWKEWGNYKKVTKKGIIDRLWPMARGFYYKRELLKMDINQLDRLLNFSD